MIPPMDSSSKTLFNTIDSLTKTKMEILNVCRKYKIITTKFNFFLIISKFIVSPNLANYQKGKLVISPIMILGIDIFYS